MEEFERNGGFVGWKKERSSLYCHFRMGWRR